MSSTPRRSNRSIPTRKELKSSSTKLKIKKNDMVTVEATGENVEIALDELEKFMQGDFDVVDKRNRSMETIATQVESMPKIPYRFEN